jgi:hypothetical protein
MSKYYPPVIELNHYESYALFVLVRDVKRHAPDIARDYEYLIDNIQDQAIKKGMTGLLKI